MKDGEVMVLSTESPYVYEILTILNEAVEPLGSGNLSRTLVARGLQISEATVGRALNELDAGNLTNKVGSKGRIISDLGRNKLARINDRRERLTIGDRFLEALQSRTEEDLIDVLMARRAIERQLASLAAINATAGEIKLMEQVVAAQHQHTEMGLSTASDDVTFHKLVALAARNKVLAATMVFIRNDTQLTPILEYIRVQVGGHLAISHDEIIQAIKARDPERAEETMINHIESLIGDVHKYWAKFQAISS